MKKLRGLILVICVPILLLGQDRSNMPIPILSPSISYLNSATGWFYEDYYGQWFDFQNQLGTDDSFIKYEFRYLTSNNKEFLVLLKYYTTYAYKYPNLEVGIYEYNTVRYWIIDKDVFISERDRCSNTCTLSLNILKEGNCSNELDEIPFSSAQLFDNSDKDILNKSNVNKILVFKYKEYNDKQIARFLIYQEDYYEKVYPSTVGTSLISGLDWKEPNTKHENINKYILSDEIYSFFYYETDLKTFYNFINLVHP